MHSVHDHSDTTLDHITMAIGWDPAYQRVDLNAAALLFAGTDIIDAVYHEQLMSKDGAVRHLGDSTTGEGDGDNELITVDLTRLPPEVTSVFFAVTSYTGQSFGQIRNAFCRLIDGVSGTEITRYDLDGERPSTGMVMGRAVRAAEGWRFEPIGQGITAEHPVEVVPQLAAYLP